MARLVRHSIRFADGVGLAETVSVGEPNVCTSEVERLMYSPPGDVYPCRAFKRGFFLLMMNVRPRRRTTCEPG